jgi:integrase
MPRSPSIRYFDSRLAYYCQYRGRQHCLAAGPKDEPEGPTYQAAVRRFAEIMQTAEDERTNDDVTFSALASQYEHHLRQQGKLNSLRMVESVLDPAVESFGSVRMRELKNLHVQRWLDHMRADRGRHKGRVKRWGDTRTRLAAEKIVTVIRWAVGQGMISRNPIDVGKLSVPLDRTRGRDYVIPPGEHESICQIATPRFVELLSFLEGTGCRPGEAYNLTAANLDLEAGLARYRWDAQAPNYVHKTAKRTRKDRVIYLPDDLLALVKRLAQRYPHRPLFRSRFGDRWTNAAVYMALKRLRGKLGLKGPMIAYSYRHTFATRWLLAGGSVKVLADLMGTSLKMIERHYGHLDVDPAALRRLLAQFRQGQLCLPPGGAPSEGR